MEDQQEQVEINTSEPKNRLKTIIKSNYIIYGLLIVSILCNIVLVYFLTSNDDSAQNVQSLNQNNDFVSKIENDTNKNIEVEQTVSEIEEQKQNEVLSLDEALAIKFTTPTKWNNPMQEIINDSTVSIKWDYKGVNILLFAMPKESCPQGHGPTPHSLSQGYYTENDLNYLNWCKYDENSGPYLVNETDKISTDGGINILVVEKSTECHEYICDEKERESKLTSYSYSLIFNTDTELYSGGVVNYYTTNKTLYDDIKSDLNSVAKSFMSTQ